MNMFKREKGSAAPTPVVPPRPSKDVSREREREMKFIGIGLHVQFEAFLHHQELEHPIMRRQHIQDAALDLDTQVTAQTGIQR